MAPPYVTSYRDLEVTFSAPGAAKPSKATVHYVEAGEPGRPKILLLHGFPASSFQYRDFIPMLSDKYHVLAPDYPGFGLSEAPADFAFSFDNITAVMAAWIRALGLEEAAIYIQDFGAPVGLRLAVAGAIRPVAIISQNGNIYEAGIGKETFAPIIAFWESGSQATRDVVANAMLTLEGAKEHYSMGTPEGDFHLLDPQAWTFAYLQNLAGPANVAKQLDFLYDYRTNVELYPTFQKYVRDSKVPILAVWGKGDPAFIPAGAEAFRTDSPDAAVHLLDAGHFALESARWEIARLTREFLTKIGH